MQKLTIRRISFGSFIKLTMAISLSMGALFGLFVLIVGLLGGPANVNLGETTYRGPMAGLLGLPMSLLMFALCGLMGALVAYLPFRLLLRLTGGLDLEIAVPEADPEGD